MHLFDSEANMADEEIKKAIANVLGIFKVDSLKLEQEKILKALLEKKDCIAVLPTGFGKSLPYQMLVPMKRELNIDDGGKVIVCSPLVALMRDQSERLKSITGISAEYKGGSTEGDERIESGTVDYVFASPEMLVGDKTWRSKIQAFNVSTIVIDEFHTISTWGEEQESEKQAFRKWFSYIGELRSLFPSASVLALSATCTRKISKRVLKVLEMHKDTIEIRISPNKPNIKLVVKKIPNTVEMAMAWLVDAIEEGMLPRTIIYCTSIKDASNLYSYLINELTDVTLIEMYHSETPEENKTKIIQGLKELNSHLQFVIATSALGMGVDIANFYNVILFGAPNSVVDLIQAIGRVGRDGKDAVALLLYNAYHLIKVDLEVKNMYKSLECRRLLMLKPFLSTLEFVEAKKGTGMHSCCDFCAINCSCGSCTLSDLEKLFQHTCDEASESMSEDENTEPYDLFDYDDIVDMSLLLDVMEVTE